MLSFSTSGVFRGDSGFSRGPFYIWVGGLSRVTSSVDLRLSHSVPWRASLVTEINKDWKGAQVQ